MKTWMFKALIKLGLLAVLLIAYTFWASAMAGSMVISNMLFSPGGHTHVFTIIAGLGFIVFRILVVFILPGIVLAQIGWTLIEAREPHANSETVDDTTGKSSGGH